MHGMQEVIGSIPIISTKNDLMNFIKSFFYIYNFLKICYTALEFVCGSDEMYKLGASTVKHDSIDDYAQIPLIKRAGFDCFFATYKDELDLSKLRKTADQNELEIETIHLPFGFMNRLWELRSAGDEKLEYLCQIIARCADVGVNKAILHCTVHSVAPPVTAQGLERFMRLFSFAQERGISLAVENLEPLPHLQAVMEILPDFHGFCWDCGHNLCYTPMDDMMQKYGHKLLCTHIHDNYGISRPGDIHYRDDLHLLPFDGSLDWNWFAEKIKASGFKGPLSLELSLKSKVEYSTMSLQGFFDLAYQRAQKILALIN